MEWLVCVLVWVWVSHNRCQLEFNLSGCQLPGRVHGQGSGLEVKILIVEPEKSDVDEGLGGTLQEKP